MAENKTIPTNLSPQTLQRLRNASASSTSPFSTGLVDFNYTMGIPLITGNFAFIYFDRVPAWFATDEVMQHFKTFFQKNFRSFDGHNDVSAQPAQYQAGTVGYSVPLPGDVAAPGSEFTTSYLEFTGSPGKAMIERWFNSIHDVVTGHSILGDMNIDYGDPLNWTADVLYFQVRKDFKTNNPEVNVIEFASYWRGVFPSNIPTISDQNFTLGQASGAPVEGRINWNGVQDISPAIKKYALKILKEEILNPDGETGSYVRHLDSMGIDEEAKLTLREDDILTKIYGEVKE